MSQHLSLSARRNVDEHQRVKPPELEPLDGGGGDGL